MEKTRVCDLFPLLPKGSAYPAFRTSLFGPPRQEAPERYALALHDPAFGWHFVEAHLKVRRWLPDTINEWALLQSFVAHWLQVPEPLMMEVESFRTDTRLHERNLLEALLLAEDTTLAGIAEILNTREEVVEAYEMLFWSVRDRRHEKGYLTALLYPDGRQAAARDAKPDAVGDRLRLLRAGAENGKAEVLALAGWSPEPSGALEDAGAQFDHRLQTEAGRRWSAGARLEDMVIKAAHQGLLRRQENTSDEDPLALHNINAVSPALDEIRKHNGIKCEPMPDYRVTVEKARAEVEAMLNITRRGHVRSEDA